MRILVKCLEKPSDLRSINLENCISVHCTNISMQFRSIDSKCISFSKSEYQFSFLGEVITPEEVVAISCIDPRLFEVMSLQQIKDMIAKILNPKEKNNNG